MGRDVLAGKVALVTGAASGIGKAIVSDFVAHGARVVALDINDCSPDGDRAALERVTILRCDVSDESSVRQAVAAAVAEHGRLDVLCNSAGIAASAPLTELSVETFERIMAVNVRGTFLTMKHSIPHMLAVGGGSIVNLASIAALASSGQSSAYSTSKGAVLALTRATAVEFAARGIRANAICPGTIETPMNADPAIRAKYAGLHLVGRLGRPAEVAAMARFLASDECTFATGAAFVVDGGRTATSIRGEAPVEQLT